jgi:hypothetical protein
MDAPSAPTQAVDPQGTAPALSAAARSLALKILILAGALLVLAQVPGLLIATNPGPHDNTLDTQGILGLWLIGNVMFGIPAFLVCAVLGTALFLPMGALLWFGERRSGRPHSRSICFMAVVAVVVGALGVAMSLVYVYGMHAIG